MTTLLPILYRALEARYNKPRTGVHVSDISLCSREALLRRLEPQKIDNTQLGFFIFGESAGLLIQSLVNSDPERFEAEHEVIFEGLQAHIDLYDKKNNIPIEIKTANIADMEQPKPHYTSQLRAYMAMKNANTGIVLVFLTQHFRSKKKAGPFREWIISMTDEQLAAERERLKQETISFQKALEAKKPEQSRHVMNDNDLNWKCNYCKFLSRCQDWNKQVRLS